MSEIHYMADFFTMFETARNHGNLLITDANLVCLCMLYGVRTRDRALVKTNTSVIHWYAKYREQHTKAVYSICSLKETRKTEKRRKKCCHGDRGWHKVNTNRYCSRMMSPQTQPEYLVHARWSLLMPG